MRNNSSLNFNKETLLQDTYHKLISFLWPYFIGRLHFQIHLLTSTSFLLKLRSSLIINIMDNNYSPLLYFNEDTSLEDSSNKVALLDESPVQIYAVQKSLKRKAKAHCDAIIEIISQLSDEVYVFYILLILTLLCTLYFIT